MPTTSSTLSSASLASSFFPDVLACNLYLYFACVMWGFLQNREVKRLGEILTSQPFHYLFISLIFSSQLTSIISSQRLLIQSPAPACVHVHWESSPLLSLHGEMVGLLWRGLAGRVRCWHGSIKTVNQVTLFAPRRCLESPAPDLIEPCQYHNPP
jgi:hypothetical protein